MDEVLLGDLAIEERMRIQAESYQLPLIDMQDPAPTGNKSQRRQVSRILSEVRRLHEELNSALYSSKASEKPMIQNPLDAFTLLYPFMGSLDQEELWTIPMNVRNRVIALVKVYRGSVNCSQVRIGEVFRQAVIENASGILIAHNHPSGDPSPSPDDVSLTRGIVQAGKILDIEVMDHIVIAGMRWVSLKERGLGF